MLKKEEKKEDPKAAVPEAHAVPSRFEGPPPFDLPAERTDAPPAVFVPGPETIDVSVDVALDEGGAETDPLVARVRRVAMNGLQSSRSSDWRDALRKITRLIPE